MYQNVKLLVQNMPWKMKWNIFLRASRMSIYSKPVFLLSSLLFSFLVWFFWKELAGPCLAAFILANVFYYAGEVKRQFYLVLAELILTISPGLRLKGYWT
jgi:hypothetical protein